MGDRGAAVERRRDPVRMAAELGLGDPARLRIAHARKPSQRNSLPAELAARIGSDLERGFTGHGPHRDELSLLRDGRELRTYGSQGQQRLALLALLLAEREAIGRHRGGSPCAPRRRDERTRPVAPRRSRAAARGRRPALITASEPEHVPGAEAPISTLWRSRLRCARTRPVGPGVDTTASAASSQAVLGARWQTGSGHRAGRGAERLGQAVGSRSPTCPARGRAGRRVDGRVRIVGLGPGARPHERCDPGAAQRAPRDSRIVKLRCVAATPTSRSATPRGRI